MRKRMFLMFIGLSLFALSYAQTSATDVVGKSEIIHSIAVLKDLAAEVNKTHHTFQQSSTGSRSSSSVAKSNYDSALAAYLKELENQLLLQDNAEHRDAIQSEISLVKQLQGASSGTK